jgi:hypothetical protein
MSVDNIFLSTRVLLSSVSLTGAGFESRIWYSFSHNTYRTWRLVPTDIITVKNTAILSILESSRHQWENSILPWRTPLFTMARTVKTVLQTFLAELCHFILCVHGNLLITFSSVKEIAGRVIFNENEMQRRPAFKTNCFIRSTWSAEVDLSLEFHSRSIMYDFGISRNAAQEYSNFSTISVHTAVV